MPICPADGALQSCLLWDQRLGLSPTALTHQWVKAAPRVLTACPSSLQLSWQAELELPRES